MATEVNSREVTYPGMACSLKAYVAEPAHGGHQHPAVIVVHEWWGLDDHIKDIARRLAGEHAGQRPIPIRTTPPRAHPIPTA